MRGGGVLSLVQRFLADYIYFNICYNSYILYHNHYRNYILKKYKNAFTLAEILITLGIIGIVAALTIPALIDSHNKQVVATRLEKFHSMMNQAITMAELDFGPRDTWFVDNIGYNLQKDWIEKYIKPYLKTVDSGNYNGCYYMTFADGSSVVLANSNGRDWFFFPGNIENCWERGSNPNIVTPVGKCVFPFYYNPVKSSTSNGFNEWNFETYGGGINGTISNLKNHSIFGCNNRSKASTSSWPAYCTRLIQVNGWKIPDDYPFRVKYR